LTDAIVSVLRELTSRSFAGATFDHLSVQCFFNLPSAWRQQPNVGANSLSQNASALAARLQRGMWMPPDEEKKAQYEKIFHQLCRATRAQLEALEAFAEIDWRE
jgi:hypothetical protein